MFKKTLVIAAPVLASAAIVAAGLGASTQANAASGQHPAAPVVKPMKSVSTSQCDGKAQKATWNRGVNDWVYAGSDDGSFIIPGSILHIKGPKTGKDVVSVNFSAAETYLSASSEGRVKVLLDGVPLDPSDLNTGTTFETPDYGSFAQNYCATIGRGNHAMRVVISDNDFGQAGDYFFELHEPMLHVEQSD